MNIELNNESSIRRHSSILENEKKYIQQAYQNAAHIFRMKESPSEDQSSRNTIHKYVSKKAESKNQILNTLYSKQLANLVCHMKWVKNAESKWIPVESNHVKEHGDYSSYFCASTKNQQIPCRQSSSDSILTNLKETESETTVLNTELSPSQSKISFDQQSTQDIQSD